MTLPPDLRLRDATLDDLADIARLRGSVGWSVNEWALRAVIGRPGARCVVVTDGDGWIGAVGSGIVYRPIGFVGNMIVAEELRRRGVGSAILRTVTDDLEAAGCNRLELNATGEGRPLYERHGFASIGRSSTARLPRGLSLERDPSVSLRRAGPADADDLAAYDLPRFGGDRRDLLAMLLDDPAAWVLLARRDGRLAGFACVRPDETRIGPVLADAPSIAETLVHEAFDLAPAAYEMRLNLPPNNEAGAAWLAALGVTIEPWDGRMARGAPIQRRDDTIYGMTVGALG